MTAIWTINAVAFFSLFVIWNRNDLHNLLIKVCLAMLAFVNAAPAFALLQKAFQQ